MYKFLEFPKKLEAQGQYIWLPLEESIVQTFPQFRRRPYYCTDSPDNKKWILTCKNTWEEVMKIDIVNTEYLFKSES